MPIRKMFIIYIYFILVSAFTIMLKRINVYLITKGAYIYHAVQPELYHLHIGYGFLCLDEPDGMHTSERSKLDIYLSHIKCMFG